MRKKMKWRPRAAAAPTWARRVIHLVDGYRERALADPTASKQMALRYASFLVREAVLLYRDCGRPLPWAEKTVAATRNGQRIGAIHWLAARYPDESQSSIARRLGISPTQVNRVLKGRRGSSYTPHAYPERRVKAKT